jgi:hypothetical protein
MSSLPKGEGMGTKLVELFANMVVERRNMIKVYLGGGRLALRVLGGVDSGGVLILSFLILFVVLPIFVPFVGLAAFPFI